MKNKIYLESPFETYETIGEGGSGKVYKVKDGEGFELAAKILNPQKNEGSKHFTYQKGKQYEHDFTK